MEYVISQMQIQDTFNNNSSQLSCANWSLDTLDSLENPVLVVHRGAVPPEWQYAELPATEIGASSQPIMDNQGRKLTSRINI